MNIQNLLTRAGAGIIYILVILAGVLGGKFSFLVVFAGITGLGLFEYFRMIENKTAYRLNKTINILVGIALFSAVFLYLERVYSIYLLPVCILLYLLFVLVSTVLIDRKNILHSTIYAVFGQIYITLPLSLLMFLSYQYTVMVEKYHYALVLSLFIFLWVNDTAAYLVGSLIGKHKLIERISPKKSIEGFVGGILFSALAGYILSQIFNNYSVEFWVGLGIVIALFGTLGDLFESLIKRTCGVKDSGNIIPGHGGILDRIDSLLLAVPAAYLYLILFATI